MAGLTNKPKRVGHKKFCGHLSAPGMKSLETINADRKRVYPILAELERQYEAQKAQKADT